MLLNHQYQVILHSFFTNVVLPLAKSPLKITIQLLSNFKIKDFNSSVIVFISLIPNK